MLEVTGCGFGEGMMLDTGGEKTEEEGDFGGEWRDDFLSTVGSSASCSNSMGEGGGGKSSMMLVSLIGGGGDGGAGFWRKTSSKSSCDRPVSGGCCWSVELKRLDSEIRSEDRCWWTDG